MVRVGGLASRGFSDSDAAIVTLHVSIGNDFLTLPKRNANVSTCVFSLLGFVCE